MHRTGRNKKNWGELGTGQKVTTSLLAILQFCLLASALWDLRRRPAEQIRGPKFLWSAFVFVNFAGPISYFLFGRRR